MPACSLSILGLQSGSGVVLFRDGVEVSRYEESGKDEFVYYIAHPELAPQCEIPALVCGNDEVHIVVETILDRNPKDTTWELIGSSYGERRRSITVGIQLYG
jgi:hypothetical protein